jgi:glutaredoxin 3
MPKVVLFNTPTCSWCPQAKRYFRERRVTFKEINLERAPPLLYGGGYRY